MGVGHSTGILIACRALFPLLQLLFSKFVFIFLFRFMAGIFSTGLYVGWSGQRLEGGGHGSTCGGGTCEELTRSTVGQNIIDKLDLEGDSACRSVHGGLFAPGLRGLTLPDKIVTC